MNKEYTKHMMKKRYNKFISYMKEKYNSFERKIIFF